MKFLVQVTPFSCTLCMQNQNLFNPRNRYTLLGTGSINSKKHHYYPRMGKDATMYKVRIWLNITSKTGIIG